MKYYIVTSSYFNFEEFYEKFDQGLGPRHIVYELAKNLDAGVYQPKAGGTHLGHWVLSKFIGGPSQWVLVRTFIKIVRDRDIVYCTGEDTGIPLAILFKLFRVKAKLAMRFTDPDKIRTRFLFKLFNLKSVVNMCTTTIRYTQQSLVNRCGIDEENTCLLPEQTDDLFFRPGVGTIKNDKYLIASAGLEERDYLTLSQAIEGLDLEIKVCAHSPNFNKNTHVKFPERVPANMEVRYFEFDELRDLYRSADLVVISLLENTVSAGLTVLMEAIACRKPVIITNNIGFGREFIEMDLVVGVRPGDPDDLKQKIEKLMKDEELARNYAEKAHAYFLEHNTANMHINMLTKILTQLSGEPI